MRHGVWLAVLVLTCAALVAGCSSSSSPGGSSDGGDGGSSEDRYLLEGWFGGAVAEGGFGMWIGRLDPEYASAEDCQVALNGQSVNLMQLMSTADDAFFAIVTYDYAPNTQYTIGASLGGRSATCSFTAPEYPWIEITAPTSEYFAPGEPIDLVWEYEGGTPEHVYVTVSTTDGEDEVILIDAELAGSTLSYSIGSSVTADWGAYDDVLITVDGGEDAWPFSGELAVTGSAIFTVLPGDAIILYPGQEPEAEWYITIWLDSYMLEADGASTSTLHALIEDEFFNRCPDGTEIAFSAMPDGYVTLDPITAQTVNGEATASIMAGSLAGDVALRADALGTEASTSATCAGRSPATSHRR